MPKKRRSVGKLVCGLGGSRRSSGHFFSPGLERIDRRTKAPKCSGMFYDIELEPGEVKALKFAVQFQRCETTVKNPVRVPQEERVRVRT